MIHGKRRIKNVDTEKKVDTTYLCDGITVDFYLLYFEYLNFFQRFNHE